MTFRNTVCMTKSSLHRMYFREKYRSCRARMHFFRFVLIKSFLASTLVRRKDKRHISRRISLGNLRLFLETWTKKTFIVITSKFRDAKNQMFIYKYKAYVHIYTHTQKALREKVSKRCKRLPHNHRVILYNTLSRLNFTAKFPNR